MNLSFSDFLKDLEVVDKDSESYAVKSYVLISQESSSSQRHLYEMNYLHRLCVGRGFCYAAERHEPLGCFVHPKEQGMSTMPLSHCVTFGNTFLKMFAAPFMSAFVIVRS